jgi:hypothetical protein
MGWLTALAVLCAVVPSCAKDKYAEKVYRAMEKQILSAKSLHWAFDGELEMLSRKGTAKGAITFAQGNKARMELVTENPDKSEKVLFITDGKSQYKKQNDNQGRVKPLPNNVEQLDKALPGLATRLGLFSTSLIAEPGIKSEEDFDLDRDLPVKNFKLGAEEMIGKRNAQIVNYEIGRETPVITVSVWIDMQT